MHVKLDTTTKCNRHLIRRSFALLMISLLALIIAPPIVAQVSVWDGVSSEPFKNGTGTETDPYLIESAAMLKHLADIATTKEVTRDKYYSLMVDIDMDNQIWKPISVFSGNFWGNKHDIYNYNSTGGGLFNMIDGFITAAEMNSATVRDFNILWGQEVFVGRDTWGGIANKASKANIYNCIASIPMIRVDLYSDYGGIVGQGSWCHIVNCISKGSIDIPLNNNGYGGAIIGSIVFDKVRYCYSEITFSEGREACFVKSGGYHATISNNYYIGTSTTIDFVDLVDQGVNATNNYSNQSIAESGYGIKVDYTNFSDINFINEKLNGGSSLEDEQYNFTLKSKVNPTAIPKSFVLPKKVKWKKSTFDICSVGIILNWQLSTFDGDVYANTIIERSTDGITYEEIATIAPDAGIADGSNKSYSYTDSGIDIDSKYHYRLITEFEGAKSTPLYLRDVIFDPILNAPTLEQTPEGFVKVSWPDMPSHCAENNTIEIQRSGGSSQFIPVTVDGGTPEYIDETVSSCNTYTYKVIAKIIDKTKEYRSPIANIFVEPENPIFVKANASKGIYSKKVELTWGLDKPSMVTEYEIQRKRLNTNDTWNTLKVINESQRIMSHTDSDLSPGLLYEYRIIARNDKPNCAVTLTANDFGFCQPFGVATGRITFGSGTAVQDATVMAVTAEEDVKMGKSLKFGPDNAFARITMGEQSGPLKLQEDYSIQFYLKMDGAQASGRKLIDNPGIRATFTEGNQLQIGNLTADIASYTASAAFFQVTYTANKDSAVLYIDGVKVAKGQKTADTDELSQILLGNQQATGSGTFLLDELRLWKKSLTAQETVVTFDRYLSGGETGLVGYYTFDEGVEDYIFDRSNTSEVYNENHGTTSQVLIDNRIPEQSQLALKALTDKNGNFIIKGIPYTGSGTQYNIVPSLGVHEFNPAQTPLYIAPSSEVTNNMAFTDISSFPVTGTIRYANTTIPVEGVTFKVDGQVCSRDGEPLTSNAQGEFKIDVAIGEHFIVAEKDGHGFLNGGRFPAAPGKKYNFQQPMTIDFSDTTRVIIAGRVAGGEMQTDKPLGFADSKANIGQATLVLKPVDADKYSLNAGTHLFASNQVDTVDVESTIEIGVGTDQITIQTDPETGEFTALLPPITYKCVNLYTKELDKTALGMENLGLIAPDPLMSLVDSLKTDEETRYFSYHQALKVKYKVQTPIINVVEISNKDLVFGDKQREVMDGTNKEKLELYTVADGNVNYTMGYPIYTHSNVYRWKLNAYEQYVNNDGAVAVYDSVPMAGCKVTFANELGRHEVVLSDANSNLLDPEDIEVKAAEGEIELNDEGEGLYSFRAGFPKTAGDYLLSVNISVDNNGKIQQWDQNGKFKAYVLGALPKGNNFVTKGPDVVDMILRDPAGSNSYSYMEKGSTTSVTHTYETKTSLDTQTDVFLSLAPKITMVMGFIAATELEFKPIIEINNSFVTNSSVTSSRTTTNTTTTNTTVSTSGSPDYVGRMGDVYIGNSSNAIFGSSNIVDIRKSGEGWAVTCKEDYTMGIDFETAFKYTEVHIENVLIPEFENLKKGLNWVKVTTPEYTDAYVNNADEPVYITLLDESDEQFGTDNHDPIWNDGDVVKSSGKSYRMILPVGTKGTDVVQDMVVYYNSQINAWKKQIAINEEAKIKTFAKQDSLLINHSFDAGITIDNSKTTSTITDTSKVVSSAFNYTFSYKTGALIQDAGGTVEVQVTTANENSTIDGTSHEEVATFGYHIEDEDAGDAFSLDVFKPEDRKGLIFRTRGGRTSCPWESGELTKYYKPGAELSAATIQLDKPLLNIKTPIISNIPSGKEANVEIELNNISEGKEDMWYRLGVDDESNPDGLIIKMDGSPLTAEGRLVQVNARTPLMKTLTVSQSKPGVMDYKNIILMMMSNCQCDPTSFTETIQSNQSFTVQFVPSCSDLKLTIPSQIVNMGTGPKLPVIISDFSREYTNFGAIRLQYKGISDNDWTTLREFVFNKEVVAFNPNDKNQQDMTTNTDAAINYTVPMDAMSDGLYEFRAITLCGFGNGLVNNETVPITVTKDMSVPMVMGKPSPANGILTPADEVSILFNKHIQPGKITKDKIQVKGVLNGYEVRDNVGLSFDGQGVAYTELPINIGGSFSIEAWVRREAGKAGTLFLFGSGTNITSLGFTSDNKAIVKVGNKTILSEKAITDTEWQYLALQYDADNNAISLKRRSGNSNEPIIVSYSLEDSYPSTNGRLYVGNTAANTDGFAGNVRQISFWSDYRTETAITADFNLGKSGNERYLTGYWPLEEGSGKQALDKARARHLTLNTAWFIHPQGKAAALTGDDSYVRLKATGLPFTSVSSYTIQFWFKGEKGQTNATLFSAGSGLKEDPDMRLGTLSVAFAAEGDLKVHTIGNTFKVGDASLLDNQWHHFALSVTRGSGNAVVYIDGTQKWQTVNTNVGSPAAEYFYLGACGYKSSLSANFIVGDYFKGSIDEVRVYDAVLPRENILLDMHSKLNGNEVGLKAYYPFEKYDVVEQQQTVVYTLDDMYKPADGFQSGGTAESLNCMEDANTPAMKDVRPVENVAFNYTASDNKVVINITESMQRIENCTLEFSVEKVMDANGNSMVPAVWTAYVDLNRLKWTTEEVVLTQNALESATFKAVISNAGAVEESFILEDIPVWLKASTEQGTIKPQKTQEITFTVDPATNIGAYEATILLSGKDNVNEPLQVKLTVLGEQPNWKVNPSDFESSMSVTAQVKIENVYQESSKDIVGAFIGDLCVGVGSPSYVSAQNGYYLFLDVYGNATEVSKEITFRLWEAATGRIYPNLETNKGTLTFSNNGVYGSMKEPVILTAKDRIELPLNLLKGWNWLSVNVENAAGEPGNLEQFKTNIGSKGIVMKGQLSYLTYNTGRWNGSMTEIAPKQMYMLQTNQAHVLNFVGKPASVTDNPITLKNGWNWIGYIPQFSTNVGDALAGISELKADDIIKGQTGYAIYDGQGWRGSLQYLVPGRGYMFYSGTNEQTFHYPSKPKTGGKMLRSATSDDQPFWKAEVAKFEHNMTLLATVSNNGEELTGGQYELGVFKGEECRGSIRLQYNPTENRFMAYLTAFGTDNEELEFRLYDHNTGDIWEHAQPGTVQYRRDAMIGTLNKPYDISFSSATGIAGVKGSYSVYPTRPTSRIHFTYPLEGIERLEVIHANGSLMLRTTDLTSNSLDVSVMPAGVYYMRILYQGKMYVHIFIKQ